MATKEMYGYGSVFRVLKQHRIPKRYPADVFLPDGSGFSTDFLHVRAEIAEQSGYTVLTGVFIGSLAKWIGSRRCLETMGGCGSLSAGLQQAGVNVLCTDSYKWTDGCPKWFASPWTIVERLDAVEAIKVYGATTDIVICSMPEPNEDCYQALLEMREQNPAAIMLYIGEPRGGANANDAFFAVAKEVVDESFAPVVSSYKTACFLHERPMLFC